MITETSVSASGSMSTAYRDIRHHHSVCWAAISAGVITAIGIHLLLVALAAGIGLATFSPLTDQHPAEAFTVGAAICWDVCALIALATGGFVAGWFSASPKTGCLHGIVVWSVTVIIAFALVSTGGSLVLGGALKALGTGLRMTGATVAAGAAALAKTNETKASNQLNSFVEEATKSAPTNATPGSLIRTKREVGLAVTQLFAPGGDVNSPDHQAVVEKSLTQYAGLSESDAKNMVNEWVGSYNQLKAESDQAKAAADQKARQDAEKAAKDLSAAATESFFALLIGLIVTVLASISGAHKMQRHARLLVTN